MLKYVSTDKAPKAIGPYSQAVIVNGMVYTSGQIAINPATQAIIEGGIEEQTELVISNLKNVLEEAGSSMEKVVKTTVFLKDMGNFQKVNAIYEKHFVSKPARSAVEAARLPKDVMIEIECIAYI